MVKFKDGPMACPVSTPQDYFLHTFTSLRTECIRLLEVHDHRTPDRYWQPGDPQAKPPRTAKDKTRLKVYLTVTFKEDNKPLFPPANTRLSDELVYLATKFLKTTNRSENYPYDFDHKGDINPTRIPSGPAPIIWAHGLPFFPVYKGYYILCGRAHGKWIGWLLNKKEYKTTTKFPMWTIGPVVAPASAVEMPRAVERQLRVHKAWHTRDFENGEEHAEGARDVVSTLHCDLSLVPADSGDGFALRPIYEIDGYNVYTGPDWENGRPADLVDECVFRDRGVRGFDYKAALMVPYVNQRCPLASPDGVQLCREDEIEPDRQVADLAHGRDEMMCEDADLLDYYPDEQQQTQGIEAEGYETTGGSQTNFNMETDYIPLDQGQHSVYENRSIDDDETKDETTDESQDEEDQSTYEDPMETIQTSSKRSTWKKIKVPKAELQALLTKAQRILNHGMETSDDRIPERIIEVLKRAFEKIRNITDEDDALVARPTKRLEASFSTTDPTDEEGFFHHDRTEPARSPAVTDPKIDNLDASSSEGTYVTAQEYFDESLPATPSHGEEQTETPGQHAHEDIEMGIETIQGRLCNEKQPNQQAEGSKRKTRAKLGIDKTKASIATQKFRANTGETATLAVGTGQGTELAIKREDAVNTTDSESRS